MKIPYFRQSRYIFRPWPLSLGQVGVIFTFGLVSTTSDNYEARLTTRRVMDKNTNRQFLFCTFSVCFNNQHNKNKIHIKMSTQSEKIIDTHYNDTIHFTLEQKKILPLNYYFCNLSALSFASYVFLYGRLQPAK